MSYPKRRKPSSLSHIGQTNRPPAPPVIPRRGLLGWAFVFFVGFLLLVILGFVIWTLAEVLKLKTQADDIEDELEDQCPNPCPNPCPNVTLICPDLPVVDSVEESDLCNDWNECTLDLLTTFDNETQACKNLLRPNGHPCESLCFAPLSPNATDTNTTTTTTTTTTVCHKGICVGENCLGECEVPEDCPVLNATFDTTECLQGACVYTNTLIPSGPVVDCSADVFQHSCECAIANETLRDCLVTDVLCGEVLLKKRQEPESWFVLCSYSFFCAKPKVIPIILVP